MTAPVVVNTIVEIPIDAIQPGDNDRKSFPERTIVGLAQPVTVRPVADERPYQLVAGERRWRAHLRLQAEDPERWATIPAIVKPMSDEQASVIMGIENLQREDLEPVSEAQAIRKRMDLFGYSVSEVAAKLKINPERVKARLELLDLRDDVQRLVSTGNLPLGHARAMSGLDPNRQGLALAALDQAGRMPTLTEFRALCGELYEQQAQEALFDPDAFTLEAPPVLDELSPDSKAAREAELDPRLPPMRNRKGGTRTVLTNYLAQLREEGLDEEARLVATVVAELNRCTCWALLDKRGR